MTKLHPQKKKILLIGLFVVIVAIIYFFMNRKDKPEEKKERFYHVAFSEEEMIPGQDITVDVLAGDFVGEFPAASFQISFDPTKLTFLKINQGNVKTYHGMNENLELPQWPCEASIANRDGLVSTMYLDTTAKEHILKFQKKSDGPKILFQLVFHVRDSMAENETVRLKFTQATLAAVNEEDSLSMQKGTIKVFDQVYITGGIK